MPPSYQSVFDLESDFGQEDLDHAYDNKVSQIKNNVKNEVDKQLYFEQLNKYYREAQRDLLFEQSFEDEFISFGASNMEDIIPMRLDQRDNWKNPFEQMKKMQQDMVRTFSSFPDMIQGQNFTSSTTYNEKSLPDGSRIIVEKKTSNKDGHLQETTNSYKKLRDGKTEPIDYTQALQYLGNDESKSLM